MALVETSLSDLNPTPTNICFQHPGAIALQRPSFFTKKSRTRDLFILFFYLTLETLVNPEQATISMPFLSNSSINKLTPKESEEM